MNWDTYSWIWCSEIRTIPWTLLLPSLLLWLLSHLFASFLLFQLQSLPTDIVMHIRRDAPRTAMPDCWSRCRALLRANELQAKEASQISVKESAKERSRYGHLGGGCAPPSDGTSLIPISERHHTCHSRWHYGGKEDRDRLPPAYRIPHSRFR